MHLVIWVQKSCTCARLCFDADYKIEAVVGFVMQLVSTCQRMAHHALALS